MEAFMNVVVVQKGADTAEGYCNDNNELELYQRMLI